MSGQPTRLGDLGERRLIGDVLWSRYGGTGDSFGDDCAPVTVTAAGVIVATTDPAPRPVAYDLGMAEPYHWGWLLAAINLSDIAAAGAMPLGLLTSFTLPNDMPLADFERLLDGVDDCCAASGTVVIGGNLKEAVDGQIRCEATAVGITPGGTPVRRTGASAGDVLVAFGPTGGFWAAMLVHDRIGHLDGPEHAELLAVLVRPTPQVALGLALRQAGLVRSATDASDGLYAAVTALTGEQGLGCVLDGLRWSYPGFVQQAAALVDADPLRLALGFGDLQLVCAVARSDVPAAKGIARAEGVHMTVLGDVVGEPGVRLRHGSGTVLLANFDNERFSAESQFTAGLTAYRDRLLTRPLQAD